MEEAAKFAPNNPASLVFTSERASNQEMQVRRLTTMGFNAFRVSFESQCTSWKEAGPYDAQNLERSFRIAERFKAWIIVDYHGYNDTANAADTDCWLNFWNVVIQQFKDRYVRTVWEPLNEPTGLGFDLAAVPVLSSNYQRWIDQTRRLGDTSWIVVQNLCSFRCDFDDKAAGYPTVTDPLKKVFISLHPGMNYRFYWRTWDNSTADARAVDFYESMKNGTANIGWPVLNSEGGPSGTFNGTQRCPDLVTTGSAGYCATNFHFIQTLTQLLDSNQPSRLNWMWWTISSETDTPGTGLYGALNSWGKWLSTYPARPILSGDDNNDWHVDLADAATLGLAFGSNSSSSNWNPYADLNSDGRVDGRDAAILAQNYGRRVVWPGDLNGDLKVDIVDAALLAYAFGSNQSSPNWNPDADFNKDRVVDVFDSAILGVNFGQVY